MVLSISGTQSGDYPSSKGTRVKKENDRSCHEKDISEREIKRQRTSSFWESKDTRLIEGIHI